MKRKREFIVFVKKQDMKQKDFVVMKNKNLNSTGHIVNGVIGGHPFLNHKNHASGGALVQVPVIQKGISNIEGRKLKASRPAIMSANAKGAV